MHQEVETPPVTNARRAFSAYVAGRRQARYLDTPKVPPGMDGGEASHFRRGFWKGKEKYAT